MLNTCMGGVKGNRSELAHLGKACLLSKIDFILNSTVDLTN